MVFTDDKRCTTACQPSRGRYANRSGYGTIRHRRDELRCRRADDRGCDLPEFDLVCGDALIKTATGNNDLGPYAPCCRLESDNRSLICAGLGNAEYVPC